MKAKKEQKKKLPVTRIPKENSKTPVNRPKEIGGPKGPEPTRYGDWERRGRCIDF